MKNKDLLIVLLAGGIGYFAYRKYASSGGKYTNDEIKQKINDYVAKSNPNNGRVDKNYAIDLYNRILSAFQAMELDGKILNKTIVDDVFLGLYNDVYRNTKLTPSQQANLDVFTNYFSKIPYNGKPNAIVITPSPIPTGASTVAPMPVDVVQRTNDIVSNIIYDKTNCNSTTSKCPVIGATINGNIYSKENDKYYKGYFSSSKEGIGTAFLKDEITEAQWISDVMSKMPI